MCLLYMDTHSVNIMAGQGTPPSSALFHVHNAATIAAVV